MRADAPFRRDDLADLDARLLSRAARVIPTRDVYLGDTDPHAVAVRHDVDDNAGSLTTALGMAAWERSRGYRSTYFLLHGAHYWADAGAAAREITGLGHEVGIHVNALGEAIRHGGDPHRILLAAVSELRQSVPVIGAVAHGDPLCHVHRFVNDEAAFLECARPDYGDRHRVVAGVKLAPRPMGEYGLEYDANWLPRGEYLSDSGGRWSRPFDEVAAGFPYAGQLHVLQHPDWWAEAFT